MKVIKGQKRVEIVGRRRMFTIPVSLIHIYDNGSATFFAPTFQLTVSAGTWRVLA